MEKLFNWVSVIVGILGGICVQLFGAWNITLQALLGLMILDYITGVIKAIYLKQISSEIGLKGLLKKIVILIMVAMANIMQHVMGDGVAIREIVIMFFIANEGISLLENAAAVSNKIPQKLKDLLLQLRDQGGGK